MAGKDPHSRSTGFSWFGLNAMSRTCNVSFMDRKTPGLQRGKQDQDSQVCLLVVPLSVPALSDTAPRVGIFPIHAFYLSSTQQLTEGIKQADSMARNPAV